MPLPSPFSELPKNRPAPSARIAGSDATFEQAELPGHVVPVVSANGANGGIVWATEIGGYTPRAPVVLHAFDATNLSNQLYVSPPSGGGAAGTAVKFSVPVVANGKVYVGCQGSITVFGLLPN